MMPDFDKLTAQEEHALLALFEDARAHEPEVSSALMSRVIADAADMAPKEVAQPMQSGWQDRLREIFGQLGGIPGASLMTACALLGLSLGYAGPDSLIDVTELTDMASANFELDAEMDAFQTTDFQFDEGELLQ